MSTDKSDSIKLPLFPSMQACTAATGIPRSVLRKAKVAGCAAFDAAGRVNLGKLVPWLFAEIEKGDIGIGEDWPLRLQRAQALLAELKLRKLEESTISADVVEDIHSAIESKSRALMASVLEEKLPELIAGRGVDEVRVLLLEASRVVCAEMAKGIARWIAVAQVEQM